MELMEDFKRNRTKLLKLKDDVILFISQKNDNSFNLFSTEITILFRTGKKVIVKYITGTRGVQFHDGMFAAYLGTKQDVLSELTVDEFIKELRDFGSDSGFTTSVVI